MSSGSSPWCDRTARATLVLSLGFASLVRDAGARGIIAGMSSAQLGQEQRHRPLILIVEDQSELRHLYAQQLVMCGFDVIEAGNGVDAIAHTTSHVPDVVLMDLSLPIVDGWEATRQLKKDVRTAHIP